MGTVQGGGRGAVTSRGALLRLVLLDDTERRSESVRRVLTGEAVSYLEVRCGGRRQVHFLEALQAFGVALSAAAGHGG